MSDDNRCKLTDAELEEQEIEIPADETDKSFFDWIDNMIEEEFKDVKDATVTHK